MRRMNQRNFALLNTRNIAMAIIDMAMLFKQPFSFIYLRSEEIIKHSLNGGGRFRKIKPERVSLALFFGVSVMKKPE